MSFKATILLVEDEIFTRRMMQIYFENEGYEVMQAASAQEALVCIEKRPADLVISDIMMPEISGLELLQKIREQFSKEELPVILLTGLEDTKQIVKAMALGANDFVNKTKEFRIVLARVALHLDWKRLKQASKKQDPAKMPEHSKEGAWCWNLNGGTVTFSKQWQAILGFEDNHLESNMDAWLSRIHPEDFRRVSSAIGAHQEKKTDAFAETYRILNAKEQYIWVRSFGVAVFDDQEKPRWMAGSLIALNADDSEPST